MSSLQQRFFRQLRSEGTVVRTDRIGAVTLLFGFLVSVAWGTFMCYLTVFYQHKETYPSPRVPASGLAQLGYFALMVWAVLLLLGLKAKGFWNMRVLVEPKRTLVLLSTLVHLTVGAIIFAIFVVGLTTPLGILFVKFMGADPAPLIGAPSEIAVIFLQMAGFAVGVVWLSAGIALACNSVGIAITFAIVWPLLVEGMFPDEGVLSKLQYFLPFRNGFAWFQNEPSVQLLWAKPLGLVYFLVLSLIIAFLGVWLRRNETLKLDG